MSSSFMLATLNTRMHARTCAHTNIYIYSGGYLFITITQRNIYTFSPFCSQRENILTLRAGMSSSLMSASGRRGKRTLFCLLHSFFNVLCRTRALRQKFFEWFKQKLKSARELNLSNPISKCSLGVRQKM